MAEQTKPLCTIQDVEYAFRVARMLLGDIRQLRREFRDFRDGWTNDDDDSVIPPGEPVPLVGLLIEIQKQQREHDQFGRRVLSVVEDANLSSLTPFVYESPFTDFDCPRRTVTALDAVDELAFIATESCSRLVFNVDGDGQPRHDIPAANSDKFRAECAACEQSMRAVTTEELARLEALLRIEELRTLNWLRSNFTPTRWSPAGTMKRWEAWFKVANCAGSEDTIERRITDGSYTAKQPREKGWLILDINTLPPEMQSEEFWNSAPTPQN